ncbi:MAG: hypothetical protein ACMXX9_03325 [Candidatus Woesearchaeota archaeon]
MRATLTFNNVYDTDVEITGSSGHDLARANRLARVAPPSFIVTTNVLNAYLDSGVSQKIKELTSSGSLDYNKLKLLFSSVQLSNELLYELKEAYESLNVGDNSNLLSEGEPVVNLFLSPDYYYDYDYSNNIILNISGFKNFIDALKSMWLRLYTKENVSYRKKNGIEFFSAAVIVQKAQRTDATVEVTVRGKHFSCQAYKGLLDLTRKISKDGASCVVDNITDMSVDIASQEFKIVPDEQSASLLKIYLKDKSLDQKISTALLSEVARISKKIKYGFSSNINALFSVYKDSIWLLYVQTIPSVDFDVEEEDQVESEVATLAEVPTITSSLEVEEEPVYEFNFDKEQNLDLEESSQEEIVLEEEPYEEPYEEEIAKTLADRDVEEDLVREDFEKIEKEYDSQEINVYEDLKDEEDLSSELLEHDGLVVDTDEVVYSDDLEIKEDVLAQEESDDFLLHHDHILENIDENNEESEVEFEESIFGSNQEDLIQVEEESSTKVNNDNYLELENKLDVAINKLYRESFGFSPIDYTKAIAELNVKHSIKYVDDLIDFKNLIKRREQGNSIDEELLGRCIDSVHNFLKENA